MGKMHKAHNRITLTLIVFILILASVTLSCNQGITYWESLDQRLVIKSAKDVTHAKYPNADVVTVDQKHWIKYQKDGAHIEWNECYTKILTERGRQSFKTVSSYFTIPYNTTKFNLVEVLKNDGTVNHIDISKNSRVMINQAQMKSGIYNPDSKILRVTIPQLNLGDIIHFVIFDDYTKARVPETWSDYVNFEGIIPVKRSEYTVVAPKKRPLQNIALKAEIPGTVTHTKQDHGDSIIYRWIARNVPRAFPEPKMPPLYSQTQRLLVSTITDWKSISRWYWNLSKPNIEKTTPEMKKTVEHLTKDIIDPHEKIRKIFKWVSQEIRYLGLTVEKNAPGYEPHPVNMTFDRRAGVCRDKAALLVAMLRLAGFDSYPVLIMVGPKKDPDIPQPFFNHAISCVREENGSYLLMDSTDENTKQLLPTYLNNLSYLIATSEGETLRTSPIQPARQNMMDIKTEGRLDKAGNLKAKSILSFNGINDNAYRGYFSRLPADERRGYFEKIIKKIVPGARLIDYRVTPSNILDTKNPLKADLNFEAKNILISGKNIVMMPVPRMGNSVGLVHYLIEGMGLKKRKYPLFTRYSCGVRETLKLDLDQSIGKPISLPEYESIENAGTIWKRNTSINKQTLVSENVFKMKLPEYSPKEYLILKETLKKIESENRKMPIFSKSATQNVHDDTAWYSSFHADAAVLNEMVEYDLQDANNWTETKHLKMKILTYGGKKKNSDIYINYNPVWEDISIRKAVVTSPTGEVKAIENKEINEMDAAWVGNAPRYPAAKTLVISLPGVEKGSIIEYTIVRKKKNRPFFSINDNIMKDRAGKPENFSLFSIDGGFRYYYPVVKKTVRLKVPDHLHLKILKADGGIGLENIWKRDSEQVIIKKSRHIDGKTIFEFTATKVEPVKYEGYMPPLYSFNPVIFASAGDWKHYAENVRQTLIKAASSKSETTIRAKELISGIHNDTRQITAIRDFVAKNIHPIDLGINDLPLDQITPADKTLADGYGNSADRAVLLYSLLRAAGCHPEFVLTSGVPQIKCLQDPIREYPAPGWFYDVLIRLKTDQGYIYLNDTDQYARPGSTPHDGYPALLLQSGEIKTISASSPELNDRDDATLSIKLSKDGDATIKITRKVYGMDFASFHKQFAEMTPEKRRRYHQELVASVSQAATADSEYITNYNVYPGIEEFSVKVKKYATRQGNYLYLELPGLISGIEGVERDKRDNPMYRYWAVRKHVGIKVILPDSADSVRIIPPESFLFRLKRSGQISMKTGISATAPMCLSIQQDINLNPVVVLPEEYLQLLEANRILSRPETGMLLLKMKKLTKN
jgi:transglutaminase-like putative cysteine protease